MTTHFVDVQMTHEDLGMRIGGGTLKADAGLRLYVAEMDEPVILSDDDWDYEIEWCEGIPHCACCGRFCLYADEIGTDRDRLVVVSMPGIPISEAMCPECLKSGAVPYGLLVSQAACVTDLSRPSLTRQWAPWFVELVAISLRHHGKSWQAFLNDVKEDARAMEEYMKDHSARPDWVADALKEGEDF